MAAVAAAVEAQAQGWVWVWPGVAAVEVERLPGWMDWVRREMVQGQ
jgi:hypothetical protein